MVLVDFISLFAYANRRAPIVLPDEENGNKASSLTFAPSQERQSFFSLRAPGGMGIGGGLPFSAFVRWAMGLPLMVLT